jgi:hypothetical protein
MKTDDDEDDDSTQANSSAPQLLLFTDRTLITDMDERLEQRVNPPQPGPIVLRMSNSSL